MKRTIVIGTLNCQNNEKNRSIITSRDDNISTILINNINDIKYDYLAVQEMIDDLTNKLRSRLPNYRDYGKYRFGNGLLTNFKIVKKFNENNKIFTPHPIKYTKTYHLPFISNNFLNNISNFKGNITIPRIATMVITNDGIAMINTHLDYKYKEMKIKQLAKLLKMIKKYSRKYKIILMGDLNMDLTFLPFKDFIEELERLDIKRIEINKKTHKNSKEAIDHIFVSNNFKPIECGLITTIDPNISKITDHTGLYAKLEIL